MRNLKTIATSIVVLIILMNHSIPTKGQSASVANMRFQAELIQDSNSNGLLLNITYYGNKPTSDQTEQSLRHVLNAAAIMYPDVDITAQAWHSLSAESNDRSAIVLSNGEESLEYRAKDNAIQSAGTIDAKSDDKDKQTDDLANILADSKVVKTCKDVSQEHLSILANAAIDKRRQERKFMLKAMRDWCKGNDVELTRDMRVCMSSISKAVVAMQTTTISAPVDLTETIARGKEFFTGDNHCSNCHGNRGRGGRRGPDLTDDEWQHCNGSIEGIKKVILSGVPLNKLKDSTRSNHMKPAINLKTDKEQLNDLAIYVHSLSQNK